MSKYHDVIPTPLGDLYCRIEDEKIVYLSPFPPTIHTYTSPHPLLKECKDQIQAYFAHRLRDFHLPLQIKGSPFTQAILKNLLQIPYGTSLSYQQLAILAGFPKAYRAAGTTLSRNPFLLLLPCHRVIRSNGLSGDYAWGKANKEWLLKFEKSIS